MTIKELYINKVISVRAFETCRYNNITNVTELIDYYKSFESFIYFRKCEKKTKLELEKYCENYNTNNTSVGNLKNVSNPVILNLISKFEEKEIELINEIISFNFSKLTSRSANGIDRYLLGNINIQGFITNIFNQSSFKVENIKDIGAKSIPEINFFIKLIIENIIKISEMEKDEAIDELNPFFFNKKLIKNINIINDYQKQIINKYIDLLSNQLSVRSNKAISIYLGGVPNINLITEKILNCESFSISNIKDAGKKSIQELDNYFTEIKNFYDENILNKDENLLDVKYILDKEFNRINIVESKSIFKLIEDIINNYTLFTLNETLVLKHSIKIYSNSIYFNSEKIANDLDISKESVRQIKKELINKLYLKFKFFKKFKYRTITDYEINTNKSLIIIDDSKTNKINSIDQTNFSNQFITYVLFILFEDNFNLIGNINDVLIFREFNERFRHIWKNLYLINNEFSDIINIIKLIDDIEFRINERIKETYKFNFKIYISGFSNKENSLITDEIVSICKKIIFQELNVNLCLNDEIVFERNKIKSMSEYAYEALDDLGIPSHKDEINNRIKELNPTIDKKITNTNLKREYGFIPFGKSNVFGLKKWELENNLIKGGTIRSIAEEYLLIKNKPVHMDEIIDYVLIYRPDSNKRSIINNIKMANNNNFLFFENSYIGLNKITK